MLTGRYAYHLGQQTYMNLNPDGARCGINTSSEPPCPRAAPPTPGRASGSHRNHLRLPHLDALGPI